jgi:hypothetical protein
MTERRTRRSRVHGEALTMFLETQRTKLGVGGLTVSTPDGRLLAAAGPSPAGRGTMNVATWGLRVGGAEVVIASHGGRLTHDLGTGVRRILSS